MSDRVDAAMDPMQSLAGNPLADRAPAQTQTVELMTSDQAMLALGELRDRRIHSRRTNPRFCMCGVQKIGFDGHARSVAEAVLRVGHGRNVWAT